VASRRRRSHPPVLAVPLARASQPAPDPEEQVREWHGLIGGRDLVQSRRAVATFLSGGLDSSAVRRAWPSREIRPRAFTARYSGSEERQRPTRLGSRHIGQPVRAELTVVDIRPDLVNIFEPIIRALDEPHADDSAIPTWLLSQAVGSRYKVALSGLGGDELFRRVVAATSASMAAERYAKLPAGVRRCAGALSQFVPEPRDGTLGVDRLKRFLARATRRGARPVPEPDDPALER